MLHTNKYYPFTSKPCCFRKSGFVLFYTNVFINSLFQGINGILKWSWLFAFHVGAFFNVLYFDMQHRQTLAPPKDGFQNALELKVFKSYILTGFDWAVRVEPTIARNVTGQTREWGAPCSNRTVICTARDIVNIVHHSETYTAQKKKGNT